MLVAARDESKNIHRCLSALAPAQRVIVLDSHSIDETPAIAASAGAEVIQFDYEGGYPRKRQWAMDTLDIDTPWILLIDADETVPDPLWQEIKAAVGDSGGADGYLITKGFHFMKKRFRFGGFSHAAIILFRTGRARFERIHVEPDDKLDMEVHERLIVDGRIERLKTPLVHEDFRGLGACIKRHRDYAVWEAGVRHMFLETGRWGDDTIRPRLFGNVQERRRFLKALAVRMPCEAQLWFFYHYVLRLGFLEGRPGLIASRIRANYIADVRSRIHELRRTVGESRIT